MKISKLRNLASLFLSLALFVVAIHADKSPLFSLDCLGTTSLGNGQFQTSYRVTLTNRRSDPLTGITVTLQKPQDFVGTLPSLGAGQTQVFQGTVTTSSPPAFIGPAILAARTSSKKSSSFAVAAQSGVSRCPVTATTTTTTKKPKTTKTPRIVDLLVSKNCTANFVQQNGNAVVEVCFDVFVTNIGNVPFTSITVVETEAALFQPFGAQALPVGETIRLSSCYIPENQNDLVFVNSVVVFATAQGEVEARQFGPARATCPRPVAATTTTTTKKPKNVDLRITKNCTALFVNNRIEVFFDIFVTNIGTVPFSSLTIIESEGSFAPQAAQALPVGATTRLSGSYIPSDQNALFFTDSVIVFATAEGEFEARQFGPETATCGRPVAATTTTTTKKPKTTRRPPQLPQLNLSKNCTVVKDRKTKQIRVDFEVNIVNVGSVGFSSLTVLESEVGGGAPQTFVLSSGLPAGSQTRVRGTYTPTNKRAKSFSDVVTVQAVPDIEGANPIEFGPVQATCHNPF